MMSRHRKSARDAHSLRQTSFKVANSAAFLASCKLFVELVNSTSTRMHKMGREIAHGRSFRSRYEAVLTEKEFTELDN
jgi:hypothetical protein